MKTIIINVNTRKTVYEMDGAIPVHYDMEIKLQTHTYEVHKIIFDIPKQLWTVEVIEI